MSLILLNEETSLQFPLTIDWNVQEQQMMVELHPECQQLAVSLEGCPSPKVNQPLELVNCEYFAAALYHLTEPMLMDYSELECPVVYTCLEGSATLVYEEQEFPLTQGQQMLISQEVQELAILPDGECQFLESYRM